MTSLPPILRSPVFAWGCATLARGYRLRSASDALVAVGSPMSARRGVSRLWTAVTPSNSVLLTWQDFSPGRPSPAAPAAPAVSAQLELFRDGSFVARSNAVARAYRRVNPDDWDGDGIPNAEDADPRVAADEPRFGPRQALPPGAHADNYYGVDLVVRDADALVSFEGDAPSALPDPSFIAKAGETNRVTLLVGKSYRVRCLLPVEFVGASRPDVAVGEGADGLPAVSLPVRCEIVASSAAPDGPHGSADGLETPSGAFAVCGGPGGGAYRLELRDGGRLERTGGSFLPREGRLGPGETFRVKVRFAARAASGAVGDVAVRATVTEEGAAPVVSEATLTAVQILIGPTVEAPENDSPWRHRYGICEQVDCRVRPTGMSVSWKAVKGGEMRGGNCFVCPLEAAENPLEASVDGVTYTPLIQVIEPSGGQAFDLGWRTYGLPVGCAGGVGLEADVRILPLDVSFQGISVEEVPSEVGFQTGYFTHPYFDGDRCHSRENGAGIWHRVTSENVIDARDTAAYVQSYPRMTSDGHLTESASEGWMSGRNVWSVPFGWNVFGTDGKVEPFKCFASEETQAFSIDSDGTAGVRKFRHEVVRTILGSVYLDGAKVW